MLDYADKVYLVLLVIPVFSSLGVEGAYPFFGRCLRHSVVKDFNVTKYSGVWYEINKYFSFGDYGSSCVTLEYKVRTGLRRNDNQTMEYMTFVRKGIQSGILQDSPFSESGQLQFPSSKKNARLEILTKGDDKVRGQDKVVKRDAYWILDTDYTTFSVVWSCEHAGILNFQNAVVLTREREPSMFTKGRAYGVMQRHGLITKLLVTTDQENCGNA